MALWGANHHNKKVISNPTVPYNTPLVWYGDDTLLIYSVASSYIPRDSNVYVAIQIMNSC